MKKLNVNKILSTSLSLALAITSAPMPARAAGPMAAAPGFVSRLTPPQQFGYVASSFASRNEEKPRLIVVADLHAQVEVQRNIMGILETLVPAMRGTSGKKVPVFLEGGWQANLEEPLRKLSNPNVRRFINEYYLHKAELGGPQAYSEKVAGTNQVTMIGVEDKEEYLVNKAIFAKSYPARKQVLEALKFQEAALDLLQDSIEGRSFKKLQAQKEKYNLGQLTADRYAKVLLRYANRFHMENRSVSVLKNLSSANPKDVDVAFENVYRAVSIQLSSNRPWTSFLRAKLPNENAVRTNLAHVKADLDLLKRLVGNQLTPSEVTLAMSRIVDLQNIANLLLKDQPVTVGANDVIRQSLEFYPMALMRDETLVKNSLKSLDSFGADATGILVAGGFHTDSIASYLRERQIPYMVIHPNVTRDLTTDEQLNYVKRMGNEHVTPKELKSDLAWIKTGHRPVSSESKVSFTGVQQNVVNPTDGPNEDSLFGGYPDIKAGLETLTGDAYVAAVKAMDELGLDVENADRAEIIFKAGEDGKYVAEGGVEGAEAIAAILNDGELAIPGHTVRLSAIPDKEAILNHGSEATHQKSEDGKLTTITLASSRLAQLKAVKQAQVAGSKAEANAMRAIVALKHEQRHDSGLGEAATTVAGLADAGKSVAQHMGNDAVSRLPSAVDPQLAAGKETKSLVGKLAGIFTPKALQAKTVKEVASELAQAFPQATQEQIELQLAQLGNTMEGQLAIAAAQRGVTGPLQKKFGDMFKAMLATASNA